MTMMMQRRTLFTRLGSDIQIWLWQQINLTILNCYKHCNFIHTLQLCFNSFFLSLIDFNNNILKWTFQNVNFPKFLFYQLKYLAALLKH